MNKGALLSAKQREGEEKAPPLCVPTKQALILVKLPPSSVGSNLFYTYKDTEPFPCPALQTAVEGLSREAMEGVME